MSHVIEKWEQALEQAEPAPPWRSAARWKSLAWPAALLVFALGLGAVDFATDHTRWTGVAPGASPSPALVGTQAQQAAEMGDQPLLAPPRQSFPPGPWGGFGPSSFPIYNGSLQSAPTIAPSPNPYGPLDVSTAPSDPLSTYPSASYSATYLSAYAASSSSSSASTPTPTSVLGVSGPTPSGGAPAVPSASGPASHTASTGSAMGGSGALGTLGPLMPWPGYSPSANPLGTSSATLTLLSPAGAASSSSAAAPATSPSPASTGGKGGAGASRAAPAGRGGAARRGGRAGLAGARGR